VKWLESTIAVISPSRAAARAKDRITLDRLRGYEGAATGRRVDKWKTSGRDANAEIRPSLQTLRNRSSALRRDNPYASAAIESIIDNTVGYGIKPKFKGRNKSITKRATELWKQHAETKSIDYDGIHDIYGLQALAMGCIAERGGVLVRVRWRPTSAKLPLPFQIQVLEPDLIDLAKDGIQSDGEEIINGVQYKKTGGVAGYWMFETHPGAATGWRALASTFVPARDVLYVYRMDRAGQAHGVPWAAPVVMRLRNFDEVEDAYIEREKVAACFAVFFTTNETDGGKKAQSLADRLEPGLIDFAPPGTGVEFANPPGVNGYKDFSWVNLHAIAAGFGVPYEVFGDLAGVNFSSGRMGWQNYQRRIDRWQWQMFIPGFCGGIANWFNQAATMAGALPEDCRAEWVPPRRMMVNPKEEIAAKKEEIRNGLSTWSQAVTELGYDPTEQAEAIAEDNSLLDAHKLKLDCDPRFALPAGSAGATAGPGAASADDPENPEGSGDKGSPDYERFKAMADAYGVAVRAGAITPQREDEDSFRLLGDLPVIGADAGKAWAEDKGFRRPITLRDPSDSGKNNGDNPEPGGNKDEEQVE
jgi:lambda family phage portal protein